MTDSVTLGSGSLADFLDHLGLSPGACGRVVQIDRMLAEELEGETIDADRCTDLVLEAADLVSGGLRPLVPSSGGFDFDAMDWGSDEVEEE